MASQESSLARLAELMHASSSTVVLNGAGMSTESGLPDYRGASGLWRNHRFEKLASIGMWRSDTAESGRSTPNASVRSSVLRRMQATPPWQNSNGWATCRPS